VTKEITGKELKYCFEKAAEVLIAHREELNMLNVFPVPDGDTGSNMSMAMIEAVNRLEKLDTDDLTAVAGAIKTGTLMGARGNSGVILSQIFHGFINSVKNKKSLRVKDFIEALDEGRKSAYRAVMKPVEGTILTEIRLLAANTKKNFKGDEDFELFFRDAVSISMDIVQKTQNMLPKLKAAGVVDAGAKGLAYIMKGFYEGISGKMEEIPIHIKETKRKKEPEKGIAILKEPLKFKYCTEIMVKDDIKNTTEEEIRTKIGEFGDSIVIVKSEGIIKVHVHTNHPGAVIEEGVKWGELLKTKIDNMAVQHERVILTENEERKKYGIIVVSAGKGFRRIFEDLGADRVINGGQTMNPSIADLKEALDKIRADTVFIFPNNENIIMSAEQLSKIENSKKIIVVPTSNVQEGIAALVAFDKKLELNDLLENMKNMYKSIKTIAVTYAIRDSKIAGTSVKKGDVVSFIGRKFFGKGKDINDVAYNTVSAVYSNNFEILSIYYGKDVAPDKAKQLKKRVQEKYPAMEVEIYDGGQPHYYYLIALE